VLELPEAERTPSRVWRLPEVREREGLEDPRSAKSKRAIAAKDPAPGLDGRHALVPRDTTTPELSWIGLNALLVETKEIAARRVAAIEKQIAAVESENDGVAKRAKALARSIAEN
jgi:hypothetical protein